MDGTAGSTGIKHTVSADCSLCHSEVVNPDDVTFFDAAKHGDFTIQYDIAAATCTDCHTSVTSESHTTHVVTEGYACAKCHDGYDGLGTHRDGTDDVGAGLVAFDAFNPAPAWYNGGTGACSDTWCHGPSSRDFDPLWGLSAVGCGNCHTTPMSDAGLTSTGGTHTTDADCNACHSDVINPDNTTFADPARHLDRIVDVSASSCDACHTPAPSSGSHTAHVSTLGYACVRCHDGYFSDPNHNNGSSDTSGLVAFDTDNPSGTYNEGASSCGSTWCHGPNSASADPVWGGAVPSCGQCHPNPPTAGSHARHTGNDLSDPANPLYNFTCTECHYGVNTAVPHVDFTVDVVLDTTAAALATGYGDNGGNTPTWNGGATTCGNVYCHSNGVTKEKGGAYDLADIGSTLDGVLAYNTPTWGNPASVSCGDCHAGAPLGTALATADYPDSGEHRKGAHSDGAKNRAAGYAPCASCHSTALGDARQGTYGTAQHVDGALDFHPYRVPSGGTIQNPEGSDLSYDDGHCGNSKGCWY